jgi:hypothetical protein
VRAAWSLDVLRGLIDQTIEQGLLAPTGPLQGFPRCVSVVMLFVRFPSDIPLALLGVPTA